MEFTSQSGLYNTDTRLFNGTIYGGNFYSRFALQAYFAGAFNGSYGNAVGSNRGGEDFVYSSTPESDVAAGIYKAIGVSPNITDRATYLNNTRAMMNNVATSLTNR
jgi:hypothetical protein